MLTLVIANIDNIHSFYPLFLQCCRKLKASSNLCVNNKSIAHDPPFCFEYGEMHPGNLFRFSKSADQSSAASQKIKMDDLFGDLPPPCNIENRICLMS